MPALSKQTIIAFDRRMERVGVPPEARPDCRKWVRFYLDFCRKHGYEPRLESSVAPFLSKLASKRQTAVQRKQASLAVSLLIGGRGQSAGAAVADAPQRKSRAQERAVDPPPQATSSLRDRTVRANPEARPTREVAGGSIAPDRRPVRTGGPTAAAASAEVSKSGASWEREYRELEGVVRSLVGEAAADRRGRPLNFFQYECCLHAPVPRVDGGSQRGVKTVAAPWARSESGFILLMEAMRVMLGDAFATARDQNGVKSIREHWDGIVAYLETRLTNGPAEAVNGIIQTAKRRARGFRTFECFQTVIYLIASKLNFDHLPNAVPCDPLRS